MATYYVDDGGNGTNGSSWANAYTSVTALDAAVALAAGDVVYIGHDHVCQYAHAASLTITGPASGIPITFISVTQGSSPVTYQASTTKQIDTTEGAFSITFDGSFALYGISMASGGDIALGPDSNENYVAQESRFALAANGSLLANVSNALIELSKCVIDLTADGTTTRANPVISVTASGSLAVDGLTFVNAGYRTGSVFAGSPIHIIRASGCDFSGFTNGTVCELFENGHVIALDCKTASTWTAFGGTTNTATDMTLINCGSGNQPLSLIHRGRFGDLTSSSSIYRSNGRSIKGAATSWLITTNSWTGQDAAYKSPWIYGDVTTGSKTFDLFIVNDSADLTDAEVWLEIDVKEGSDSGKWSRITDCVATRVTTPVAQTDDTTSIWNGSGPSFTYKQKLSVAATINTTGEFRARVVVGKASITSGNYLCIDPLIVVS